MNLTAKVVMTDVRNGDSWCRLLVKRSQHKKVREGKLSPSLENYPTA